MAAATVRVLQDPQLGRPGALRTVPERPAPRAGPRAAAPAERPTLRASRQVPSSLWPGAPRPQEVVGWSLRFVSAREFGLSSGRSLIPEPEASGTGSAVPSRPDPRSRRPEGRKPAVARPLLGLFTSPGPTPQPRARSGARRDWTIGLSISGDFPRGGASRPLALPLPSPFPGAGGVPPRPPPRHPVPGASLGPCWTRREGAVPQGPRSQVSLPGPSEDGGGGGESETGRSAPQRRPGVEWEVRPRQVA